MNWGPVEVIGALLLIALVILIAGFVLRVIVIIDHRRLQRMASRVRQRQQVENASREPFDLGHIDSAAFDVVPRNDGNGDRAA